MKLYRSFLLTVALTGWLATVALAQSRVVTGTVKESNGAPVPGANIVVKGTSSGSTADADGKYSVEVSGNDVVLIFSFIGFATQEVQVGSQAVIDVGLKEDTAQLQEVVVTALGVSREAKTLVYATQTVPTSQMTEVRDANNVLNSLSGKVVNAQINQGSGGPGSGARIVLRGNRSIQGSNNALIVVDGVPINNTTPPGSATSDFGSLQPSDGASNINPDDIESMTVLRGASAAALYGSQAGNGVIVITTKKGNKDKMSVTVNSGITTENAFVLPKVQNTYGQGLGGSMDPTQGASWGAQMTGQTYTNMNGQTYSYSPQSDNIKNFFRTGVTLNNSIGIQGGSEKMQTYLSYTNNSVQGIIPTNNMTRHTVNLRMTNQISKKLSTDAKITYISQDITNRPRTGEENAPVIDAYNMPRNMSNTEAKQYEFINNVGLPTPTPYPSTLNSIYQNPYWMIYRTHVNQSRSRVIGNVSAKYQINNWLSVKGRATLDRYYDQNDEIYSQGTILWASNAGGQFIQSRNTTTQQWYDLIFTGENKLAQDFKINYSAGAIYQDVKFDYLTVPANGLNVPNQFSLNFATSPQPNSSFTEIQTQSVFGQASFSYKDALFLETSLRNEWDSRLPKPYTITYPSIGASAILSEMMSMPKAISFMKLNANYAKVGNGGQAQILYNTYNYGQGAGNGFLSRTQTQALPGLKPEIVTNMEFGLDTRFVENRFGFTFTYYKSNSTNQLLQLNQPVATGYTNKYINAGNIQNSGFEIVLNATPIRKSDFSWDIALNFSHNTNKIISLDPNITVAYLGGNSGYARTATPVVRTGGSYGDLESLHWLRTHSGQLVVDANGLPMSGTYKFDANGNPMTDPTTGNPIIDNTPTYLGSFNPKALIGMTNTFNYKNFSLRLLMDGRVGGVILDGTEMNLAFSGISEVTAKHRTDSWNLGGVDVKTGQPVAANVNAQQFWQAGASSTTGQRYGVGEFFAYDATNFRVRELSLGYNIPLPSGSVFKSIRVSAVGRNLFWLYRGSSLLDIPGLGKRKMQIDPDMSLGNGNWQGVQYASMPSTRSLGFNVKLTF
jgi:TonB-linked SusC/RagA family outer membrane protein